MQNYSEETYQLIEDFLNKQLPPNEAKEVQKRIQEDAAFAKEVEWMKSFSATVEALGDRKKIEVLDAFKDIHTTSTEEPTTGKPLAKVAWLLLPFLLAGLAWITIFNTDTQQKESVKEQLTPTVPPVQKEIESKETVAPPVASAEQAKPKPPKKKIVEQEKTTQKKPKPLPKKSVTPPPTQKIVPQQLKPLAQQQSAFPWEQEITYRKGQQFLSGDDSALDKGLILLDKGEKKEALSHLETYLTSLSEEDDDFEIRLEVGKIYLEEIKNYEQATATFQRIIDSDAIPPFIQEAQFYTAISLLAKGDIPAATKQLQALKGSEGSTWQAKAASVLTKLGY